MEQHGSLPANAVKHVGEYVRAYLTLTVDDQT